MHQDLIVAFHLSPVQVEASGNQSLGRSKKDTYLYAILSKYGHLETVPPGLSWSYQLIYLFIFVSHGFYPSVDQEQASS